MDRNFYMVRAMYSSDEDFELLFHKNVIAVGWSDIDFTQYSTTEELRSAVYDRYYADSTTAPQSVGRSLNAVERFRNIRKGDYILVPYHSGVVLAEAEDEMIYDRSSCSIDLCNQRRVTFRYENGHPLVIPRNELSEGLQRRLRVRGNIVADLNDDDFTADRDGLFSRNAYSYTQALRKAEEAAHAELKAHLLDNIRSGHTNLQTGGIGLERLVCELMQAEGYTARVLAKTAFPDSADADIKATKRDAFMEKKIFVQVKHHSGISPTHGIDQVRKVLELPEYEDYTGYFITSGEIDEAGRRYADALDAPDKKKIETMDGEELIELLIQDLPKLSETTRQQLGICRYPTLIKL